MITVVLQGGAGNQLFQYGFGLAQARRLNTQVQFDATRLAANRPFSLGQWNIDSFNLSSRLKPTVQEQGMPYNQQLVDSIKDGDVIQGYWQSEAYLESVKEDLLSIKPLDRRRYLEDEILKEENSVAIHVRCGDYLVEPHKSFHGNLGWEYYGAAIQHIKERISNPKFFLFTDDPRRVSELFYTDYTPNYMIVEPGSEAADIYAMSMCDHVITANSSFSWFGAWLGDPRSNEIVIAPKNWFGPSSKEDASDVCPPRWVRLD